MQCIQSKKQFYSLEGTFSFVFNGSVVTEVSKNQEKVLRKRSEREVQRRSFSDTAVV